MCSLVLLCSCVASADPVILNGDFEGGTTGSPPGPAHWQNTSTGYAVQNNMVATGVGVGGSDAADLFAPANNNDFGEIVSDEVSGFNLNSTYTVTYSAEAYTGFSNIFDTFEAAVIDSTDTEIGSDTENLSGTYTTYTFNFVATTPQVAFAFAVVGDGGDNPNALLDDVSVALATPEIGGATYLTPMLLTVGALSLLGYRRRSRTDSEGRSLRLS